MKLAIVFACAVSLHAQIRTVLKNYPNRSPEVEIRNLTDAGVSAFAIRMPAAGRNSEDTPMVVFVDALIDRTAAAIGPNGTYNLPVRSRIRPGHPPEALFELPIVSTAIYADGTTAGDEALLHRLLVRRGNMLQAVELAQKILADAGQRNLPRAQLTGQFQTLANSLNHWYLPPEQQVGRDLYQSIAGKLIGLPDVRLGEAFPPTEFVNREVAELGRLRTVLLQSQASLASR